MKRAMQHVKNLARGIVKIGKAISTDDSKALRQSNVSSLGKTQRLNDFTPYGLIHNPPQNSMAVILTSQGDESVSIAIIDDPNNRPRDLQAGESGLANYITGSVQIFKANGDWDISVQGNVNLECTGNLTAEIGGNADITAQNTVFKTNSFTVQDLGGNNIISATQSGTNITSTNLTHNGVNIGDNHVHTDVESGTDNTGAPVQ